MIVECRLYLIILQNMPPYTDSSQEYTRYVSTIVPKAVNPQFLWVWDQAMPKSIYYQFPWINPIMANGEPNDIIVSSPLYKLAAEMIQAIQDILWEGYVVRIVIHRSKKRVNKTFALSEIKVEDKSEISEKSGIETEKKYDKLVLDILYPDWDTSIDEIELNPHANPVQTDRKFLWIIFNLFVTQYLKDQQEQRNTHS